MSGHVLQIVRYPVKGLAGVPCEGPAALRPGCGLRWDRGLAIENGVVAPQSPSGWNPRETYFHLAKNEQIARIGVDLLDPEASRPTLTVRLPGGQTADTPLGSDYEPQRVDALLSSVLPAGARLARTGTPLWDWPQAHLSLINMATVAALGDAVGRAVDPRRFRANIYLDGLDPWAEFGMLGSRLAFGSATLEVFQPTDRCRATSIDPATALSNLNVPALLAGQFGHLFCGVYARVVKPGAVSLGDAMYSLTTTQKQRTATEPKWPRRSLLLERCDESPTVTSFWFSDPLADQAKPGQHVRVHAAGLPAPSWRCYTVSGTEAGRLRISVKRDGAVSGYLHDTLGVGDPLVLTGPFGDVTLDPAENTGDVLLLSAGIGVTPTVAMLEALVRSGPQTGKTATATNRRIRVLHVARSGTDLPLWPQVCELCDHLPNAQARLFLTRSDRTSAAQAGGTTGRPTTSDFAALLDGLDLSGAYAYACGPATFAADMRATLATFGLPPAQLRAETFFSPATGELRQPRPASTTGPHRLVLGEERATWTNDLGTILDAVEGVGIDWPSGCRAGACGTCAQALHSGEVEYLSAPLVQPAPGTVLVCCSAPLSDLVLGEGAVND